MVPLRRRVLLNAFRLFDLSVVLFALTAATMATSRWRPLSAAEVLSARISVANLIVLSGLLLICHLVFSFFGYYRSRRLSSSSLEMLDIGKGTGMATLALLLPAAFAPIRLFTPAYLAAFFVVATATIGLSRLVLRWCLRLVRARGRNLRHMLIVGTNPRAVAFARKITARPEIGYHLVGFVDEAWDGLKWFGQTGYVLAGGIDHIREFLRNNVVDEVILALPVSLHSRCEEVRAICREQGIHVKSLAYNSAAASPQAEEFEGDLLIRDSGGASEGWPAIAKRVLDISIALPAIIVLSPLLLLAAVAIKLTSQGPVLFVHQRIGLNKRKFKFYKFRTMVPDAEQRIHEIESLNEASGPVFKIRKDPRITRLGAFLRQTSIDELPQLFNVLKGDMSLVGPRPLPIRDVAGFREDWHRRRFSVPPGLTCLWQIQGRSSIPFERWMELDLRYINEWSFWLDLKILLKTIPVVIRRTGAA